MGVTIESRGAGDAVLFLHGTPTAWDVLRPVADAVVGRRTLLAALPGYGDAPARPSAFTVADIARAIEDAVRALGVSRLRVVGFSGGAYHALQLALRGVIAVDAVVVLGGFADLTAADRAGFVGLAAALRAGAPLAGVATSRFLSPTFAAAHPDARARVEAWIHATSPENLARELDAMVAAPSLLAGLAGWGGRVVARTGSLDLAAPPAKGQAIASAARRGVFQQVDGAGHALLEENRDATIAAVLAAL